MSVLIIYWHCFQVSFARAQLAKKTEFASKRTLGYFPNKSPGYRGYYTVARRCEFYVRVARTISHEWGQRTSGILFLPREHKVHIFELTCNVLFIIYTNWWRRFWWFSEDFWRFSKIVLKARRTFPNIFREFPKIPENVRRFPKTVEDYRGRPEDVSMISSTI